MTPVWPATSRFCAGRYCFALAKHHSSLQSTTQFYKARYLVTTCHSCCVVQSTSSSEKCCLLLQGTSMICSAIQKGICRLQGLYNSSFFSKGVLCTIKACSVTHSFHFLSDLQTATQWKLQKPNWAQSNVENPETTNPKSELETSRNWKIDNRWNPGVFVGVASRPQRSQYRCCCGESNPSFITRQFINCDGLVVSTCFNQKKGGFLKRGFPQFSINQPQMRTILPTFSPKWPSFVGKYSIHGAFGNNFGIPHFRKPRIPAAGWSPARMAWCIREKPWRMETKWAVLGFFGPMFDQEKLDKISIERW